MIWSSHRLSLGIAGILTLVSVALTTSALWPWWSVQLSRPHSSSIQVRPVVFLLPHQDDEMFMAGSIHRYVNSGRPVYAVVVTDGAGSAVRKMLNGETVDTRKQSRRQFRYHQPSKEGYEYVTVQEFSAARNREVLASLQVLGVPVQRILFSNEGGVNGTSTPIYRDKQVTVAQATEVIKKVYDLVGDGTYVTLASGPGESILRNPDHWTVQLALQGFEGIREKLFYVDREVPQAMTVFLTAGEQETKHAALQNYYVWDPAVGRYAIGEHSVGSLLDQWQTSTVEYVISEW